MKRLPIAAALSCAVFAGVALAQEAPQPLPELAADLGQTTVSGISSGGFMAAQLATAFSGRIAGVGVVAAGPFYCAHTYRALANMENAMSTCMTPMSPAVAANAAISWGNARKFADAEKIDPVSNLKRQRVYVFSGARDNTVRTIVADQVEKYYLLAGAPRANIRYVRNADAGHAFVTGNPADQDCGLTKSPYINNCGVTQAEDLLRHLYPQRTATANGDRRKGDLIRFDQLEFVRGARSSMDEAAWVYVPDDCRAGGCAVHVAFHGCHQGASEIGDRFYARVGYNGFADSNRLIVLYPQARASRGIPLNPEGCWDFWGYSNNGRDPDTFATRRAPQMAAVMDMVKRLGEKPSNLVKE